MKPKQKEDASILSQRRRAHCDWGWNLQPIHYVTVQQWSKYLFISGFFGWSDWWKPTKNLLLYLTSSWPLHSVQTVHNICCLLSWVSGSCRVPRCQIICIHCCLPYLQYNIHSSNILKCQPRNHKRSIVWVECHVFSRRNDRNFWEILLSFMQRLLFLFVLTGIWWLQIPAAL